MKNIMMKVGILLILLMPFKVLAGSYAEFYNDDETIYFNIYGDDADKFENDNYSITDITDDVKNDSQLINKINEYGTLIKAIDFNLKIDGTLENYNTYIDIFFDYDSKLTKDVGCLLLDDNGNLLSTDQVDYYKDEDEKYISYEFANILHDGKVFIIKPLKTNYKFEDQYAKVNFNYYKYKQYTNNTMFFGSIDKILDNNQLAKNIATSKGYDYDTVLEKNYGDDYVIDELASLYREDIVNGFNKINDGCKYLNMYGLFFMNNIYNTYESINYFDAPIDISIKIDESLKDYSNFAVYNFVTDGMVDIDSGTFSDEYDYYIYDEEEEDYIQLITNEWNFMVGDAIPEDKHFLEYTNTSNYRVATSEYFTFWGNYYNRYYTFDGSEYHSISDFNVGDRIDEYGQTVYIRDEYVQTEDAVFQEGKTYRYESHDSMGYYEELTFAEYRIGDSIEDYINKIGKQLYYQGIKFSLIKEDITAKDGYITFTFTPDLDPNNYVYPIFLVSGKKGNTEEIIDEEKITDEKNDSALPKVNKKKIVEEEVPNTGDNIDLYMMLLFISILGFSGLVIYKKRV